MRLKRDNCTIPMSKLKFVFVFSVQYFEVPKQNSLDTDFQIVEPILDILKT